MNDQLTQILISEADKILSSLKLSDPVGRMASNRSDNLGKTLMEKGLLSEAVEAYKDQWMQNPDSEHLLYYRLFRFVEEQVDSLSRVQAPPRDTGTPTPILISFPVWGAKYIRMMLAVLLPTLMSRQNLPALSERSEVIVEFSTKSSEAALIEESYWYGRLNEMPNVTPTIARYPDELFETHPDAPEYIYRIMGVMHHMAIFRARAMGGMHVLPLCSDYIMSEGVLSKAVSYLDEGFELVMMPSLKVRSDQALPKVLAKLNGTLSRPEIEISARQMSELGVQFMHPEFRQLIVSIHTKPFSKLPFPLLFPKEDGYVLRSFVLQPIVVSANLVDQEILYDFNTVDGVFLPRILAGRNPEGNVKFMADSDDGIMLDMADFTTIKESNVVQKFELGHVINWLFHWRRNGVEEFFRWMFQQRALLRAGKAKIRLDPEDIDEETTVTVLNHVIGKFG